MIVFSIVKLPVTVRSLTLRSSEIVTSVKHAFIAVILLMFKPEIFNSSTLIPFSIVISVKHALVAVIVLSTNILFETLTSAKHAFVTFILFISNVSTLMLSFMVTLLKHAFTVLI
ncbi:hypothetical protein [Heterosigma akashiwo virus 01]|uniref:Uncharacterized protein n=1 Tax=Heterosigma akashiwo virus 01 TaxID=97195 RepID=A0A1C9C5I4_HAV01|nr:hypothetical protein D1R72_gp217 [Heterosigma akashiwo virus 01]AOM63548.1 hypothetical protein [Heterosigma akashiwo virus 01]